jgi:hypothetical protein
MPSDPPTLTHRAQEAIDRAAETARELATLLRRAADALERSADLADRYVPRRSQGGRARKSRG